MKRCMRLITLMLGIGLALSLQATEIIRLEPLTTGITMDSERNGENVIRITVSEIRLDSIEINGENWAVPRVPEASNLMEASLPGLPFLDGEYLLGRTDGIQLSLLDLQTRDIDLSGMGFSGVAPSKGHFDRNIDPDTIPWVFDTDVYSGNKPYPSTRAWVDTPAISGPFRFQSFRIPLAGWNARTNVLTVIETARFAVISSPDFSNPRIGREHPITGLFGHLRTAVNASQFSSARSSAAGRLLILAYDDFVDESRPLADWEKLVGYPTLLTALSSIPHSGSSPTTTDIKNYIQSLYDDPEGLAWIILVGDSQQIPTLSGLWDGAPCDTCYAKLEGNDNHPDAAISRISAQTGADVAVQVDKILHYEQQPDTGSAATWYTSAFGIAGNDTGGTPSYADWERMEMLRKDLVTLDQDPDEPHYTYTEFDDLYHSPSVAEVGASVDAGAGLGLYIGHGGETYWLTSGFSTTDVGNLTNGEMLPVIWDVACVNGRFTRSGGDCFAESWLKHEGGGAVSFEGSTTNESWVPPCDAQRGVVDAIRNETDFTAGAQHLAGKEACFSINGDDNSDEGNKFSEQSTLFGSAVLWPRTGEATAIDTPDDFSLSGGVATLTVKTGGQILMKAGGAIVNFYTTNGSGITPVGSGLIDTNGVVHANVSGEPTHCHIHGHNLIPASFELSAATDARVSVDKTVYSCSSEVAIRISDADAPGAGGGSPNTVTVTVSTGRSSLDVTATETSAGSGFYDASLILGTDLAASDGDQLVVSYTDQTNSTGSPQTRTATAAIDCAPPVISNVSATTTEDSFTVTFDTSEPGTTIFWYGTTTPPDTGITDEELLLSHSVTVNGLDPCTTYYYQVRSRDEAGNRATDNNNWNFYSIRTAGWGTLFEENFDSDPGWTIDNGSFDSSTGWAFGTPIGQGEDSYGNPDPTSGHTGSNVYGININGDAPASAADNELTLTTPTIDLSSADSARLVFWRWLGVERNNYDHARVRLSVDGGAWETVWENGADTIDESAWTQQSIDIDQAAGHADVRIQWTYGSSDGSWNYAGWNIDDVSIKGSVACGNTDELFSDDFEGGSFANWTSVVGQ